MTIHTYREPRSDLNKAAEAIRQAGENLRNRLGDQPLKKKGIVAEVVKLSDYGPNSIFPSDYCYNMVNKHPGSFEFPLFKQIDRNAYVYLGPRYKYSGIICWKGRPVGDWKNGQYRFRKDPRRIRS